MTLCLRDDLRIPHVQEFFVRRRGHRLARFAGRAVQSRTDVNLRVGQLGERDLQALAGLEPLQVTQDLSNNGLVLSDASTNLFASLPGAGPVMAPRLLAAMGTQRDRYQNAGELQTFSGIAPVMERSGKKKWVHSR